MGHFAPKFEPKTAHVFFLTSYVRMRLISKTDSCGKIYPSSVICLPRISIDIKSGKKCMTPNRAKTYDCQLTEPREDQGKRVSAPYRPYTKDNQSKGIFRPCM